MHILQGRHRDQEVFSDFFYGKFQNFQRKTVTTYNESTGQWEWSDVNDMNMDRDGVEAWKDHYYDFNGWDTENGYPSRATLEDLDLGYVADELESAGKLGATGEYTGT
jgi:aldehyde:ferredoxin oxidoreductase